MEQENKKYEFKAVTVSQVILIMIIWIIMIIPLSKLIEDLFHYDKIKNPSVSTNIKVLGIEMIISFILLSFISHYFISNKYKIQAKSDIVLIYINNKLKYSIPINELKLIMYKIPNNRNAMTLQLNYNNKKILIVNGLFFTKKNESLILEHYINTIFHKYLISLNFKDNIKQNKQSITHILTKNN